LKKCKTFIPLLFVLENSQLYKSVQKKERLREANAYLPLNPSIMQFTVAKHRIPLTYKCIVITILKMYYYNIDSILDI